MKKQWIQTVSLVAVLLAAAWLLPASGPGTALAQEGEDVVETDCDCEFKRTLNVSGTGVPRSRS